MPSPVNNYPTRRLGSALALRQAQDCGFSLMEMLVSVAIILLLMSAVFPFIFQAQKRFQGNVVVSESNQGARAALEVMSQEIGQAGYNPQYYPNKTSSTSVTLNNIPYWCITVNDITGINPGDWVSLDKGTQNELLEVFATSTSNGVTATPNACQPSPPVAPWIQVKPLMNHTLSYSVASYKMPYASGILVKFDASGNLDTTPLPAPYSIPLSTYQQLQFYGDINQDGTIRYVVYSISPMVPLTTVCIPTVAPGVACSLANTYTLYNLYRSITPTTPTSVPFPSLPTPNTYTPPNNSIASPMVEKVLYNTTNAAGPTGLPIFAYPSHQQIGTAPNVYTALGTIVITLCVAVNPKSIETNTVSWYTMATQIRPLNLSAAINVNNSNGGLYLPPTPKSLPMVNPTGYYP